MPAPQEIIDLVQRFTDNIDDYKSGKYNETQVRREFIDPFFVALGWDIDNKAGSAEAYKDVVHEVSLKDGGSNLAPDYGFRIGGTRKFFVEAKKPEVNIKNNIDHAFQLRRYAWSAKLPLSILTDFEEFAVYDTRVKPDQTDKASTARVLYVKFTEYAERWDEIESIFSKDAILKGSFDRYVESNKKKRGTAEVDDAFLEEIEHWRELLAHNIALRNKELSDRELNTAVQVTIDRLIFLRICEDRGIENYAQLQGHLSGSNTYDRLKSLFHRADEKYNSGLFHFREEKGREDCDNWTLKLAIDDKPLKAIIKNLYYPDSPYEFSVLPPDILGQVYEQFLGKVIRRKGKSAIVEDKPEVKKAGGVYYTPTYIVAYIVENTVGKLLEGKTPRRVEGKTKNGHPIRVLDPACGSGSFLIGAYQFLLDWYLKQYSEEHKKHPKRKSPGIVQRGEKNWILTLDERKRILLDHIYGVDIDPQAVEVTKLSLLLKVLETEELSAKGRYQTSFDRILPDLHNNIKCGNSLIGTDFYAHTQLDLLDDETRYRVNAFDWDSEFSDVFSGDNPGFDAVIGNPPYIRIQALREWNPIEAQFYKENFQAGLVGNFDIYVIFIEKAYGLLNAQGTLGFICPSKFFATDYGQGIREFITKRNALYGLVDFGHDQVFSNATTYTCLLFLTGTENSSFTVLQTAPKLLENDLRSSSLVISSEQVSGSPWTLMDRELAELADKIQICSDQLDALMESMSRGVSTGSDDVFCLSFVDGQLSTKENENVYVENDILTAPIFASDYRRYSFNPNNDVKLVFPYTISENAYKLIDKGTLRSKFPEAYLYLKSKKTFLEKRKSTKLWHGFSAPRNLHMHARGQILVPLLADRGLCTLWPAHKSEYCLMAGAGFTIVLKEEVPTDTKYVLGLVNSKLLFWNLSMLSSKFRGGWITCTKQYFKKLPIRTIDFSDTGDAAKHDQMVKLVDRMLDLNKRLADSKSGHDKTTLQRQIDSTDAQIDRLVYDLYGLTDDEIKIVEEATN